MTSVTADTSGVMYNISRACMIYCEGSVLQSVQLSGIFNDSKTFVDMPMIYEPEVVMENYNLIPDKSNVSQLQDFLNNNFLDAGEDLLTWIPLDYQEYPPLYSQIPDTYPYKTWFLDINNLWPTLGRVVSDEVTDHPEMHSFLPRNYPMIVPGGRFRESYYWDSYWIIRGLLVCNMNVSSYYIIQNLLDDVNNFGFVPNGGRIYYLDRSQPPLLSEMVLTYYRKMLADPNILFNQNNRYNLNEFLIDAYNTLEKEYRFWMNETNGHLVTLPDPTNSSSIVYLNRYFSNYTSPRPESYLEDYRNSGADSSKPIEEVNNFYHSVRAGAETGWDFSSRWILGYYNITDIDTVNVIPIELNAFMYKFEVNLAKLSVAVAFLTGGGNESTIYYAQAAKRRYQAIQTYLWDNSSFHWRDFNISSSGFVQPLVDNYTSIAYWLPMWAGIFPIPASVQSDLDDLLNSEVWKQINSQEGSYSPDVDETVSQSLLNSLLESNLIQVAGILATTLNTGQQWDSPNSWPPLVSLTIEGLMKLNTPPSLQLAVSSSS
jgi:alpha,alpha-trehalase